MPAIVKAYETQTAFPKNSFANDPQRDLDTRTNKRDAGAVSESWGTSEK
jgi:hypothetical protein